MSAELEHSEKNAMPTRQLLTLMIGSVGVVYGDIGTSPLYAFREALRPVSGDGVTQNEVIGIISLMLWTLMIIVTFKYVILLLRADNDGEGGTLSLLALLIKSANGHAALLILMGIIGAALFIGDAMITPALSVLSAVEGLKLVEPSFSQYVVPISVVILVLLFSVQSRGTGSVSNYFGPITAVWFLTMGAVGVYHIMDDLSIFLAFNPFYAVRFLFTEGFLAIMVLGAVFLTVTGAEALYADLGHFGRRPIQWAWSILVFPALVLNYLGQGAFVLKHPEGMSDPFFLMFPGWALLPAVILATAATIIASQAVITGAFSLVRQAIHMGFFPRMEILHTSETHTGQIYLPGVNTILFIGVMFLVLMFGSSEKLSVAYGIAVTGAMVVTTVLAFELVRKKWNWSLPVTCLVILPLLLLETIFLGANVIKIVDGGYVPVLIAAAFMLVMGTWRKGSAILAEKTRRVDIPLASFIKSIEKKSDHAPHEISGTAIFLTGDPESTPAALLHNLKHNRVLHTQNFILTVRTTNKPKVAPEDRYTVEQLSEKFSKIEVRFGFMELQNVSQALAYMRKTGLKFDIMNTTFYVGRRKLVADPNSGMPHWQDRLFIALANAATDPSDYFRLPTNRVVELGSHVVI